MSLINFSKDNVAKMVQELEQIQGKKIQGTELANKLESFKRQEDELKEQTDQQRSIKVSYPSVEFNISGFEKSV